MAATTTTGSLHFLNVEYFFRLLYEAVFNLRIGSVNVDIITFVSQLWIIVTIVSFLVSVVLLAWFIFSYLRYHRVLDSEAHKFTTLHPEVAEVERDHNRWGHVRALIESPHESDWRQAIIEADIMLDDLLTQLGYPGVGVGEKLRAVDPARFHTLQEAGEAHGVRNRIAHDGSAYELTEHLAHRTIAKYEAVMREHGEI